ncbi:DUF624 domain-containing protein [Brachybacterium sacelli]|uniref:Membrane protein YesL n=1 Tax=Brachybacterium sacelli TaxID=173364 RepID=A0ABS4X229_9MICO|nr:DUF624 domain-containing protein [Brachybacterium sacelli]MBP2382426.1 putative membrane protein YesL [Brachybacterium sacelli]
MSSSRPSTGPAQVPAWVMHMNEAIERVYLVLRVTIVWTLLSLLGLLVMGVAPASVAAADAFIAARHGAKVKVLGTMWASFRIHLISASVRMLPLMIVQLGSASMLWIIVGGGAPSGPMSMVLAGLAVVSGAWSTLSVAVLTTVPRVRRQDVLVSWRLAILLPGALPMRFIALVLGLAVWLTLCSFLWPLAVLVGAGTAIDLATSLLGRRTELLLEDLERSRAATV